MSSALWLGSAAALNPSYNITANAQTYIAPEQCMLVIDTISLHIARSLMRCVCACRSYDQADLQVVAAQNQQDSVFGQGSPAAAVVHQHMLEVCACHM